MTFLSKDILLMRDMWRKAYKDGSLTVQFQTEAQAHRARMLLYNAVKKEKQGQSQDLELTKAAESLEIVFGANKSVLRMQMRSDNPMFKAMGEALGQSIDNIQDPDAIASANRMLESLGMGKVDAQGKMAAPEATPAPVEGKPKVLTVPNRFYTRDK